MKGLWREDLANYEGKHFRLRNAILSPKPVQQPNPPIYIACNTSRRLLPRMAARHADALAIMWGHDPTVSEVVTASAFREEWLAAERPPEDYVALRSAYIVFHDDGDEARARRNVREITTFPIDSERQTATQAVVPEDADPDLMLFGTPDQIAEQIEERVFGLGFNEVMCSFVACDGVDVDTDGLDGWPGRWLGGMRLFASEVLPKLKAAG